MDTKRTFYSLPKIARISCLSGGALVLLTIIAFLVATAIYTVVPPTPTNMLLPGLLIAAMMFFAPAGGILLVFGGLMWIGVSLRISRVKLVRVFKYSYFTSVAVAFTVVPIWLVVLIRATPSGHRRTHLPDLLEVMFVFLSTLPSIITCLFFSICYCFIVRMHDEFKMWPAVFFSVLFGVISGLIFNAMTAITVIMYFYDW